MEVEGLTFVARPWPGASWFLKTTSPAAPIAKSLAALPATEICGLSG